MKPRRTLILLGLGPLVLAITVPSQDGTINYNCPTRQTIDTAYFGYCPSGGQGGAGALNGISTYTDYSKAPQSYQTEYTAEHIGFELYCGYPATPKDLVCHSTAGGGQGLTLDPGSDSRCTAPPTTVPQPSGGGDYRRRQQLSKRADLGLRPRVTCPFDSDTTGVYVFGEQFDTGTYADGQPGITSPSDSLLITCEIANPATQGLQCFYIQTAGGLGFIRSNPASARSACPDSLCSVIEDGSPTRRGIYMEKDDSMIRKRQVDTKLLRKKLMRKSKTRRR